MTLTSIKASFGFMFSVLATWISSIFGVHMGIMKILVIFMAIDYITGLIVAGVFKKSQKSKNGAIESRASLKGLFRKGEMLLVVYIAVNLDILMGTDYITVASIYFFIANEGISLIENIGLTGVPMPSIIINAIEVLKKNEEKEIK